MENVFALIVRNNIAMEYIITGKILGRNTNGVIVFKVLYHSLYVNRINILIKT